MTPSLLRPGSPLRQWLGPAGLIALTLVPMAAGASRVTQLVTGAPVTSENARFFDAPLPVLAHIVGSTLFLLVGALQFVPSLRQRPWHRRAGRIVVPAGWVSAASGMWMAVLYDLPTNNGTALLLLRLLLGAVMFGALVWAFRAIMRGDVRTHSAWMTRAYAIGLGAGTQLLTVLPYALLVGHPGEAAYAVLMGAGWAINLIVAEVVIGRRRRASLLARRAGVATAMHETAAGRAPIMNA